MSDGNAPVVNRNGIDKALVGMVFGKKSDNAGKHFFAPVLSEENFENDAKWMGIGELISLANTWLRKTFGEIMLDNIDEKTGILNEEQMKLEWADFSAGVQKLSDIDDQLDELQALQQSYALDEDFGATNDEGVKTERAVELEALIKQVAAKIKPLRVQKATIEAKYAERAEKRKQKKAASDAAKKAQATAQAA